MMGKGLSTKAVSATALHTSRKPQGAVRVQPWVTIGSPLGKTAFACGLVGLDTSRSSPDSWGSGESRATLDFGEGSISKRLAELALRERFLPPGLSPKYFLAVSTVSSTASMTVVATLGKELPERPRLWSLLGDLELVAVGTMASPSQTSISIHRHPRRRT